MTVPRTAMAGSVRANPVLSRRASAKWSRGWTPFSSPLWLLRANLVDDLSQRAGARLSAPNNKSAAGRRRTRESYIHLGYQRLLSFEIAGGGFDWFGNPPANRTLSAYGLLEFVDMAQVHEVDPELIERTRSGC